MSFTLPTELWIDIIDCIHDIPTLWALRAVSFKWRNIALNRFYKCIYSRNLTPLTLSINGMHDDFESKELEMYKLIPFKLDNQDVKLVDEFQLPEIQLTPLWLKRDGTKGLAKLISESCTRIYNGEFDSKKELEIILHHLRRSSDNIATCMPRGTTTAYESIFRRLFTAFQSFDHSNVSPQSILPFLTSIWNLLDIITPANLRDAQFCQKTECCNGGVVFDLNFKEYEYEVLASEKNCAWKDDKKEFWLETSKLKLSNGLWADIQWLKVIDPAIGSAASGRILDLKFDISPQLASRVFI
jgi:hypothetical protein